MTAPERRQRVQTWIRRIVPPRLAFTVWMFGSQRREVRLFAWLTFLPKLGFFPQMLHTLPAMKASCVLKGAAI
jgi:hypothetical protein